MHKGASINSNDIHTRACIIRTRVRSTIVCSEWRVVPCPPALSQPRSVTYLRVALPFDIQNINRRVSSVAYYGECDRADRRQSFAKLWSYGQSSGRRQPITRYHNIDKRFLFIYAIIIIIPKDIFVK